MGRKKKKIDKKPLFSERIKKILWGSGYFLLGAVVLFSFFNLAGQAGSFCGKLFVNIFGIFAYFLPVVLGLTGLVFFRTRRPNFIPTLILASFLVVLGGGSLANGWLGRFLGQPLFNLLNIIAYIIFIACIAVGLFFFRWLLQQPPKKKSENEEIIKKVIAPRFQTKEITPQVISAPEPKKEETPRKEVVQDKDYKLPPLEILQTDEGSPSPGDIEMNSTVIQKTLENFDISVEMAEVYTGPTVTQYTLRPVQGVKLSRITSLSNDLSLSLAAHPIRIEAPIPGRSLVGIELPNKARVKVGLRSLISSSEFRDDSYRLPVVIGKDVAGFARYIDLARMPHLLVAGATGSGKTVFLNTLILSLLYRHSPKTLRLIMVDPKRVEFTIYKNIPHLLCPVIYNSEKTCNALKWLVGELERRLFVLSEAGSRDITSYNKKAKEPMPYIVLVIDELADLMATRKKEVEAGIVRLAQMARATGIHLVLATQRPSVEVITGLIKANVTARVTFQVASQVDSRTIIDMAGAEKLLGSGDMLYLTSDSSKPRRAQGPYISEKELNKVVEFICSQNKVNEDDELSETLEEELEKKNSSEGGISGSGDDPLYEEAKQVVIEARKASASFLQRRLSIGYARAARLLDMLEEKGIIGPGEGAKAREVYVENQEDDWTSV